MVTFGHDESASVFAQNVEANLSGLTFSLHIDNKQTDIKSNLIGLFNVDNLLATAACLVVLDIDLNDIAISLRQCQAVDGRMQSYSVKDKALFVIDYAHTPDALENALETLKNLGKGRVITVFGATGDRDKDKRPDMGEVVAKMSNIAIRILSR